jgi:hypothetical protein
MPDSVAAANVMNSPIAWTGYISTNRALFVTTTSGVSQMLATNGSTYDEIFNPFINAAGTVCYTAQFTHSSTTAVYTTDGTTTRTIALTAPTDSNVIGLGIDNNGDVLWRERLANGSSKLWLTSTAGINTLIADTNGAYSSFSDAYSSASSLTGSMNIAFAATLKNGAVGIFTGPDPVADKVIEQGDSLFGGTVGQVISLGSDGINDQGSVAFIANTQTGNYVVRADPIPEPVGLALTMCVGGWLVARRRRRRQATSFTCRRRHPRRHHHRSFRAA